MTSWEVVRCACACTRERRVRSVEDRAEFTRGDPVIPSNTDLVTVSR